MTRDSLRAVIAKVNCRKKTKHCMAKIQFWILRERLFYRLRRWYNVNLTTKKIFRSSGRMW